MGCGSSSQLVTVTDLQQTITEQTDTQQCVLPTVTNNNNSDTALSVQSSIEEDVLRRVTVSKAGKTEVSNGNNNRRHSKASDRLIKIQQEAKPEFSEQMLRDKRIVTEFKHKQQLKLNNNSEHNHKEKIRRKIIAVKDSEKAQRKTSEIKIDKSVLPTDSNLTTERVDGMIFKIEQKDQVKAELSSLSDDSYDSSEEPTVIENDKCFNQETDNFWEDSFLQPDLLETEAPGSVITM